MRRLLVRLLAVLCLCASSKAEPADPCGRVPFADPYVLLHEGVYYAYGTFRSNEGVGVAVSRDLKSWDFWQGRAKDGFALHKDDSYGDKWFWAPEVYRIGNRFVMYYSAETHTCAAVADSPLGPFRQAEQAPLIADMGTIDNSLFFDRDGKPWMVFVKLGNEVWITRMEDDCLRVKPGTRREIVRAVEPWEVATKGTHIAEGPFVIYEKGRYVLTYSVNDYRDPAYAVCYATAESPEGPWTKCSAPILQRGFGLAGTGHHSLFKDREGRWRIVFHAHNGATEDGIHPRCMYIADLLVGGTDGAPELRIGDTLTTCTIARDEFDNPPPANRPVVWWWFNPNAPDAAVTRDLEGLARVGISGFHIYGGFATNPKWKAKAKWALHEAHRLGLEAVACIGNAGCGHPETDPRHAQKDVVFTKAVAQGGGTIRVDLPRKGVSTTPKNADGTPKHYWDIAVLAVPAAKEGGCVPAGDVRDVSAHLDAETGAFTWPDAPAGEWTILRVGYVPKVFGWMGCYIDHMSTAAFDAHWTRVMDPFLAALAPDERAALKGVMCDSWEAGTVSWTDAFATEFKARRGYDILPWLPVKAGLPVGPLPLRNRFNRDFDATVDELIAENHYAYQKKVANRHGLVSIAEAAGPHQRQGDVRRMQGRCDVAMGEFWMPSGHRPQPPQRFMLRDAATAAHVYGIPEVLAESFTTINTYWIESPATMKPCADRAFCDGLTRVCYHGMMLSPSLTDKPGAIRNVGTHYNPQTTWFEQSKAFNDYLARCSWMLSRGRFAADALLYAGDAVGVFAGMKNPADGIGEGYDYDLCPTEILLGATVEDGEIVLRSGMRYKALLLSELNPKARGNLEPGPHPIKAYPPQPHPVGEAAMRKIRALVEAGATLVGPRPNGPTSMNESSPRYHADADAVWGPRGSGQPACRAVGKGRVLRDRAVLRDELPPDFAVVHAAGAAPAVDWIHRVAVDRDIYFVSNQGTRPVSFTARFRTAHPSAEVWDPVTCVRRVVSVRGEGVREVALELPAHGSAFVVFADAPAHRRPVRPLGHAGRQEVAGPWTLRFDPAWGGPSNALALAELKDWTSFDDPGIRHYSGTAVYRCTFDAPAGCPQGPKHGDAGAACLDLGAVSNIAEVVLNGRDLGVAWTAPYRLPCGAALREKGNVLEIRVTNLWPNRLMFDAGLPAEQRLTRTSINPWKPSDTPLPSGLLGPVALRW